MPVTTSESVPRPTTVDDELLLALLGPRAAGGPRRAVKHLLLSGRDHLLGLVRALPQAERADAESTAGRLRERGVRALLCDDPRYPDRLRRFSGAPPALFWQGGPISLLSGPAVGVCGSRNASSEGLHAARACGEDAARLGITVVSGYAKGVDTESHLAALTSAGATIAVLAEGIDHFSLKPAYRELPETTRRRLVVVSQFPPAQRWSAGAAMTRNQVIVGLSHALIVVEAGETGGTLRAGQTALQGKRPLFVLGFANGTPQGNEKLLAAGGRAVTDRAALHRELRRLDIEQAPHLPLG